MLVLASRVVVLEEGVLAIAVAVAESVIVNIISKSIAHLIITPIKRGARAVTPKQQIGPYDIHRG